MTSVRVMPLLKLTGAIAMKYTPCANVPPFPGLRVTDVEDPSALISADPNDTLTVPARASPLFPSSLTEVISSEAISNLTSPATFLKWKDVPFSLAATAGSASWSTAYPSRTFWEEGTTSDTVAPLREDTAS